MECVPALNEAVDSVAMPEFNRTGSPIGTPPSRNVIVPSAALGTMVAVKTTTSPGFGAAVDAARDTDVLIVLTLNAKLAVSVVLFTSVIVTV
jgi:hypothetical protein